jgi:hypothetical protein
MSEKKLYETGFYRRERQQERLREREESEPLYAFEVMRSQLKRLRLENLVSPADAHLYILKKLEGLRDTGLMTNHEAELIGSRDLDAMLDGFAHKRPGEIAEIIEDVEQKLHARFPCYPRAETVSAWGF